MGSIQEHTQAEQPPSPSSESQARGVKAVLKKVRPARTPLDPALDNLIKEVRKQRPKADTKAIERAYLMAEEAHRGQMRKSGDPFITHPLGVALILAQLGLDETSIMAALLHDAVEDTDLTLVGVEQTMGFDVASLIDGLTKIDKIRFRSAEQSRAENIRKMIIATARDIRVLLIKLADRLHNMRTLAPLTAGEARGHLDRDHRGVRTPGAPARHVRDQVGARRPRVRHDAPQAFRGDLVPRAAARASAGAPSRASDSRTSRRSCGR